jgi:molecular chaperone GrpE
MKEEKSQPTDDTQAEAAAAQENPQATDAAGGDEAQREINELRSAIARWQADYENLRRRSAKELLDARQAAEADFAKSLLSVLDHFEMALSVDDRQVDAKSILDGVKITYDELIKILQKREIKSFDPTGEHFDPFRHEAIASEPSDKVAPSTVLQTLQRGYCCGDRLLRTAKVKVSSAVS